MGFLLAVLLGVMVYSHASMLWVILTHSATYYLFVVFGIIGHMVDLGWLLHRVDEEEAERNARAEARLGRWVETRFWRLRRRIASLATRCRRR